MRGGKNHMQIASRAGVSFVVVALLVGVSAPVTFANDEAAGPLPPAVEQTFRAAFPTGKLDKLDVDDENGVIVYDLEFKDGAIEKETDIAADGTMLEVTTVVEASAVPPAAMASVRKAADGATIKRIEHIDISHEIKDGTIVKMSKPETHFSVEMQKTKLGPIAEITVNSDGTVLEPPQW